MSSRAPSSSSSAEPEGGPAACGGPAAGGPAAGSSAAGSRLLSHGLGLGPVPTSSPASASQQPPVQLGPHLDKNISNSIDSTVKFDLRY